MTAGNAAHKLSRREELGVESRRKIVDAAAALMAEHGFAGTSIAAVSKRSGLPSGSIYWHFESKEGLLGAVVEEGAQRWFDELGASAKKSAAGGRDEAELLGSRTAAAIAQRPEFLRLLFLIALERKHIDETSLAAIRRVRKLALVRLREGITRRLEAQGVRDAESHAEGLSRLALAVADGTFIQNHIDPSARDVARSFELLDRALALLSGELAAGSPRALRTRA
jgi:AcrR family transcriptional regulator